MSIFMILFAVLCGWNAKICTNKFHGEYLDKKNTTAVNGIFIGIVFFRHFSQYVTFSETDFIHTPFLIVNDLMGQLLVTTFMFYSGYGVMYSIMKKGRSYVRNLPKNRIMKVLIPFDIAVILYIILSLLLGERLSFGKALLSLIAWDAVGNSNWYIFAVLMLYFITFLSFYTLKKNEKIEGNKRIILHMLFMALLTFVYMLVIREYKDSQWYNTVMCYVLGMWYAYFRPMLERIIMKSMKSWSISVISCFLLFVASCIFRDSNLIINQGYYLLFVLLIVIITMKVQVGNSFLDYCGEHLFSIYILMRLPMKLFAYVGVADWNCYVYFILCAVATVLLSFFFDKAISKLYQVIYHK